MTARLDIPEAFVAWVKTATEEEIKQLGEDLEDTLQDLEMDDYFGTEGLNKRFG